MKTERRKKIWGKRNYVLEEDLLASAYPPKSLLLYKVW